VVDGRRSSSVSVLKEQRDQRDRPSGKIDCRLALAAVSFITVLGIKGWIEGIAPVMEAPKWLKKRDKSLR
jgi:hypothetical protein